MFKYSKRVLSICVAGFGFTFIVSGFCQTKVLTGADVLEAQQFSVLRGKNIGLITNQSGINKQGVSLIDLLYNHFGLKLVSLFSPEHGIRGQADHGVPVDSSIDEKTKLVIHSLYSNHRRPTSEMLRGIDALVFDIQDVGARFYTYVTTMAYAMEEAKHHKIKFYVLDRPNPINGIAVEGPILEKEYFSFEGYFPLPLRYGMTIGELALLFNKENKIGADLEVIKMKGWRRSYWYDDTGLLWINPSPNIRSLTQATTYPCIEPLKPAGLSVGRGTDTPFEVLGAPWVDGIRLAELLNARGLPGVRFVPVKFTPKHDKFANELCGGVNIIVTDRAIFRPVACSLEIATALYKLYPRSIDIDRFDWLIGSRAVIDQIKKGIDLREITKSWNQDLKSFLELRRKYLLYD